MTTAATLLLGVLERHLSALNARSMLRHVLKTAGLTEDSVGDGDLDGLVPAVERAAKLFMTDDVRRRQMTTDLWALARGGRGEASTRPVAPSTRSLPVRSEDDVSLARLAARTMCNEVDAPSYATQKIATAVSELTRNIVKYAGSGTVELTVVVPARHDPPTGPRCFVVRTRDRGPGIPHLQEILAGRYRSKTGMGLGLLGTKRLADRFDIKSGPDGTDIRVEVNL
jgi:serine/threonine-protein kinase RsbT